MFKIYHNKLNVIFTILLGVFSGYTSATTIKIGVLALQKPTNIEIKGILNAYNKRDKLFSIAADSILSVGIIGDSLSIKQNGRALGNFKKLKFIPNELKQGISVKIVSPRNYQTSYTGGISIVVSNGALKLINYVDLENYVAAVVEAESGTKQPSEFVKIQALICRTYALAHLKRHDEEGFSLCDQTHCQVYRGKADNVKAMAAVVQTQGKVIIDSTLMPITAAFHSNCGGKTRNSEDEWNSNLSYLRAVKDTFCVHAPHAQWQSFITVKEWKKYLHEKEPALVFDSITNDSSFYKPYIDGAIYYTYKNAVIPYKKIRTDWKLKSSQFGITQQHDSLIFKGYGYGHGVGLCQEGAMQMANKGYSYTDIINFYYCHVAIIDSDALTIITDPE